MYEFNDTDIVHCHFGALKIMDPRQMPIPKIGPYE